MKILQSTAGGPTGFVAIRHHDNERTVAAIFDVVEDEFKGPLVVTAKQIGRKM